MPMRQASASTRRWLSGLNFCLADVRDGLGPFLGVLLASQGWQADNIGYVMAAGGMVGMLTTTPMGAWVDAARHKRRLLAGACVALILATAVLWVAPSFGIVLVAQGITGMAGAMMGACIMGITLGLVGQEGLSRQLGINEAWNHGGNLVCAALAGLTGYVWGLHCVLALMITMACLALACLLRIPPEEISHERARGDEPGATLPGQPPRPQPSLFRVLAGSRELLLIAITMLLFHLGNAAMLPLFTQAMVVRDLANSSLVTASAIMVAQLVMIPVALKAGSHARRHGFGRLIVVALVALPLRGVIAGCWSSPWALFPVQILDGIGAGVLGVALPGLVAGILRGSGHINAGLGAVMTVQGLGAALSPAIAGWVAHHFGYGASFITLSMLAALALMTYRLSLSSRRPANALSMA